MLSKWNTTNTFQQHETVLENEKYEFWIYHSEVTQRNRDFTKLYIKFRRAWGEFNSHLHTMNCVRLRSGGKGVQTSGRGEVGGGGGVTYPARQFTFGSQIVEYVHRLLLNWVH